MGEIEVVVEVGALGVEIRVGGVADPQIEIAGGCAAAAGFALAGDADAFSGDDTGGDADLERVGVDLAGARVGHLQRDGADVAIHDFLQCDEDVALHVVALALAGGGGALAAFRESVAAATAEELLEKVAESGAAEVELAATATGWRGPRPP